jgi:hypothetical protein
MPREGGAQQYKAGKKEQATNKGNRKTDKTTSNRKIKNNSKTATTPAQKKQEKTSPY